MKLTLLSQTSELSSVLCEGQVSQSTMNTGSDPLEAILPPGVAANSILLDLSRTQFIDSSGVGWMLNRHKHCKQAGGRIVFHSAPPMVRQTLELLQMGKILYLAKDAASARNLLLADRLQFQLLSSSNGLQRLRVTGYLGEAQLKAHPATDPLEQVIGAAGYGQRLLVDLAPLALLDSTGVDWLLKTHTHCQAAGGEVIFHGLPSQFRPVIDSSPGADDLMFADNEAAAALQLRGR